LGSLYGRIGNFINVEAYGVTTTLPWRMGIYQGRSYLEVHPTFLYEMIVTITIFTILILKKGKRQFRGEFSYIYLIIYGFGRTVIEGLRADSLMLGMFRISQIVSVMLFIVFLVLYIRKKKESVAQNSEQ
jgi:phosphatidylglycerol:prolipoprotein diacylglycerol transferase